MRLLPRDMITSIITRCAMVGLFATASVPALYADERGNQTSQVLIITAVIGAATLAVVTVLVVGIEALGDRALCALDVAPAGVTC